MSAWHIIQMHSQGSHIHSQLSLHQNKRSNKVSEARVRAREREEKEWIMRSGWTASGAMCQMGCGRWRKGSNCSDVQLALENAVCAKKDAHNVTPREQFNDLVNALPAAGFRQAAAARLIPIACSERVTGRSYRRQAGEEGDWRVHTSPPRRSV
jgi:hypothetical protein